MLQKDHNFLFSEDFPVVCFKKNHHNQQFYFPMNFCYIAVFCEALPLYKSVWLSCYYRNPNHSKGRGIKHAMSERTVSDRVTLRTSCPVHAV